MNKMLSLILMLLFNSIQQAPTLSTQIAYLKNAIIFLEHKIHTEQEEPFSLDQKRKSQELRNVFAQQMFSLKKADFIVKKHNETLCCIRNTNPDKALATLSLLNKRRLELIEMAQVSPKHIFNVFKVIVNYYISHRRPNMTTVMIQQLAEALQQPNVSWLVTEKKVCLEIYTQMYEIIKKSLEIQSFSSNEKLLKQRDYFQELAKQTAKQKESSKTEGESYKFDRNIELEIYQKFLNEENS